MHEQSKTPLSFWQELKRRKVIRVIIVYAAAAYVILELVSIIADPFGLPGWTLKLVFVLLCVGLIISVILSWIYDITPQGVQKTKPDTAVREAAKPGTSNGWKIASYVSIVVIIALVIVNLAGGRKQSENISVLGKSIAVLPFDNMSDSDEYQWFGDAITDEIIMQLYKINAFDVRSKTSIMQYKNSEKGSPTIGKELRVNYLLEGSSQRYEDQVRIRVQLIHAASDNHIWGDIFEGNWEEIIDMQIKVAKQVAIELKAVLSPEEIEQIEKRPTENPEAYSLYLKGRYFWDYRTGESLLKAIDFFNQAVELDSNYALAYIGLADAYSMLPWYAPGSNPDYLSLAGQAALNALEIDNSLAEAHASMGYIRFNAWEIEAAEKEYLKAIELDPEYATVRHWYAMLLAFTGRYDQAIDEIYEALELDPLSLIINQNTGVILIATHQYDKAIEALEKVIEIDPGFNNVYKHLARAYFFAGNHEKALSIVQQGLHKDDKIWEGIICAQMGSSDTAMQILDDLLLLSETDYVSPFWLAILHFSLQFEQQGFSYLEKAYEMHDLNMVEIRTYPELDKFVSDPRFIDLLKRMGLAE